MYPEGELKRLAGAKEVLSARIGERRAQAAAAMIRIARPLARFDRAREAWRALPSWSRATLGVIGIVAARRVLFSPRTLRRLLRWSPLLFRAAGTLRRTAGP